MSLIIFNADITIKNYNFNYSLEESESGYKNFCLIESFITSIDWLYIVPKGHRRARFVLTNNSVEKKWIIP